MSFVNGVSVSLPLQTDSGLYRNNLTIGEAVRQNLKTLILTSPGEKVFDLNFGVGLRRYLFQPMTETTVQRLKDSIDEQISKYMNFLSNVQLQINLHPDDSLMGLRIFYDVTGSRPNRRARTIPFDTDPAPGASVLDLLL